MIRKLSSDNFLILAERFFPEEFLINDLAAELKNSDMNIEVLTQVPSYPHDRVFDNYENRLFQTTEEFHNIKVHRVKTYCGYNRSVFKKIFNYLNFALLTSLWCLFHGYRFKRVFIYHTGPLTMATAAIIMRFFWWRKNVIWTQDIWPDSVYAYGFKPTWWKRILLNSFIRIIYSACEKITVSSPGFIEKLRPYTQKRVEFLPQWNQITFPENSIPENTISGKRVFTFAGNLGTVQNLDTLIEAFGELELPNCVLQFVGGGVMLEPLKALVEQNGYKNIIFTGRLPQAKMPEIFVNSDVMIISLKKEFSMTVPAKFQAYIAAGKPIMGIIGGDTADLIRQHDLGITAEQDKNGIKKAFTAFATCTNSDMIRWQKNSKNLSDTEFNREKLISRIKNMLTENSSLKNLCSWKIFGCLGGIILLGAALIVLQRFMQPEMGRDSALYLILIEKWHSGGFAGVLEYWPNFWIPPLFLHIATLLTHTGLSPETAALVICMGCGILIPLISFAIANEIWHDKRISLTAALLTAVNPSIIEMSVQAQRDIPYLFAGGWCIFFIIAAVKRNKWYWWCIAGCIWGIAILFRFEMIEFFPILGMYFVFAVWRDRKQWFTYLKNVIFFALCGVFVMLTLLYASGTEKMVLNGCKDRIVYHLKRFAIFNGGQQK